MTRSEETKAKIRAAHKGKPKSEAHRQAISRAMRAYNGDPPHGTPARYKGSRARPPCHCDECRDAWTAYRRELAMRKT